MHDYAIAHAIATDPDLRNRLAGLLRTKSTNCTPAETALLDGLPTDLLPDAVAGNPAVLTQVKTAMTGGAASVSAALDTVPDSDIEYIVLQQLTFLT